MSVSAWDPIPWMIGNEGSGVAHPEATVRIGNFVAMGGDEGVIGGLDLAVTATSPASGSVRIRPGACGIINKQGPYGEAYAARLLDWDTVPIAPTGGAARTDMVIARVEDPFVPNSGFPTPEPGMENTQQYVRSAVISGVTGDPVTVAAAGYGYSAIPLALVKMPAGASVVLPEYITDIRNITVVRQKGDMHSVEPVLPADGKDYLGAPDFATYLPGAKVDLRIPWWATEVTVKYTLSGVGLGESEDGVPKQAIGDLRCRFGADKYTPAVRYNDQNEKGVTRTMHMCGGKILLPRGEGLRDSVQTLRLEGRKTQGDARIWADDKTTVFVEWSFRQFPEIS